MLSRVKLVNFRRHRNTEFNLQEGFTVFRGANEQGKSTVFEAMSYAMFGVKAIRSSLEDAVTWGEVTSTLKVELDVVVDGVTYSIRRGKSGAECVYGGDGIVTGQTEVTNFICRLFKIDAGAASRLMLSNQNEIRGALEAGTKATTDLIERLAEFDQIDNLLELMQEKLVLGSGAQAQAQLDAANGRLDRARQVVQPDMAQLNLNLSEARLAVEGAVETEHYANERHDKATKVLAEARATKNERDSLRQRREDADRDLVRVLDKLTELRANPVNAVADADAQITATLERKAAYKDVTATVAAYENVSTLCGPHVAGSVYHGTLEALEAETGRMTLAANELSRQISDNKVLIATTKGKINSATCSFCGKDFSELPEIQAANTASQKVIDSAEESITAAELRLALCHSALATLQGHKTAARQYYSAATKYGKYMTVDDSTVPPMLTWTALTEAPAAVEDFDAVVSQIRAKVRDNAAWLQSVRDNENSLHRLNETLSGIAKRESEVTALVGSVDLAELESQAAAGARSSAQQSLAAAHLALANSNKELSEATTRWEWAQKETDAATEAVATAQESIESLAFNNELLKCVRAARPVIANRLWNIVLSAVSSYFSEMRGEKCVVSKGSDGFTVDGHPVSSLSGSTLDILGLAIRVALVRTFLPTAPFLVLDEPAAACDLTRTESMLGFLVGVGFKQILLVTHEDVSESVADHIITLGA